MTLDAASQVQVDAADPTHSTWLSANAGSGKTRVLTDRVARLLLRGVSPQNILCLTYTKAAAAEMQNRLFRTLGAWAMMPDAELTDALSQIGESTRSDLGVARTLFARAIETPGGLRIQTIHSFCASILRQFPIEAGVSPNFSELDTPEVEEILTDLIDEMAESGHPALTDMLRHLPGDAIGALVGEIAGARSSFDRELSPANISATLGLDEYADAESIAMRLNAVIGSDWWMNVANTLLGQAPTSAKVGRDMLRVSDTVLGPEDFEWMEKAFLYSDRPESKAGKWPRGKAALQDLSPWLDDFNAFMDAVLVHRLDRFALEARDATLSLTSFAVVLLDRFETRKGELGRLDFDDLIAKTAALLQDEARDWVRFRLDNRIEHILVDEAQDTSPHQWRVITSLAEEIVAGAGDGRARSLFVVGDPKQSIYSFQGADAKAFDAMADTFEAQLKTAPTPLQRHELAHSFRSSPAILSVVDQVLDDLADTERVIGRHKAFFNDLPGRVDLWPALTPPDAEPDPPWYDPVDRPLEEAAQVQLADKVAVEIKRLLEEAYIPTPKDGPRRIRPGDILVLVQSRGVIFDRLIRTAQSLHIHIAGPDRLSVLDELAVKDILSLLRFIALPEDNLSLAEALRSPLFGWTEADLYGLAEGRDRKVLWSELLSRKAGYPQTHATLRALRDASDFTRPYELIDMILTEHGGRTALTAQLGSDAADAIDAFLSLSLRFEQDEIPELTAFLSYIERRRIEVKRSSESSGGPVRVMTVHGAKGLEAPIVILPDTIRADVTRTSSITKTGDGTPLFSMPAAKRPMAQLEAKKARAKADREEAERLLYVALTRAETWLIVCGAELKRQGGFWHQAVNDAMEALPGAVEMETPCGTGLRLAAGDWPTSGKTDETRDDTKTAAPDFPKLPAPKHAVQPLNPSRMGGEIVCSGRGWNAICRRRHA